VVLKMLAQPHSNVMVFNSMQSGRAQYPVIVGQLGPSVSVIVTQVFDTVGLDVVQARRAVGQVARTAREAKVDKRILTMRKLVNER